MSTLRYTTVLVGVIATLVSYGYDTLPEGFSRRLVFPPVWDKVSLSTNSDVEAHRDELSIYGFWDSGTQNMAVPWIKVDQADSDVRELCWTGAPNTNGVQKVLTATSSSLVWEPVQPTGSFAPSYNSDGLVSGINAGCVMVGRKPIKVAYTTISASGKVLVSLKITFNGGSATAEIVTDESAWFADPSDNVSYVPLLHLEDGSVEEDFRGAVCVPAYN